MLDEYREPMPPEDPKDVASAWIVVAMIVLGVLVGFQALDAFGPDERETMEATIRSGEPQTVEVATIRE